MKIDEFLKNDWRYQGQDRYLYAKNLFYRNFACAGREHDHCEFCWKKFGKEVESLREGYCTDDNYHWICQECFSDFNKYFNWKLS